jgi:hypothetical protein
MADEITQKELDDYKALYPGDPDIQALTLDEVLTNTSGTTVDWDTLEFEEGSLEAKAMITDCEMAVGYVVFDVICLALGAVGLRSTVNSRTIRAIGEAAAPVLSKLETIIARMAAPGASTTDIAWGVFDILKIIYGGGSLGAVFSAFTDSLTWWDMILYGITGTATIIAALATDGVAFVAEVVILLATFGFLVSDSVKAAEVCGASPEPPPPPVTGKVAIKTMNGHYVTVVNNGGLGSSGVAIRTDSRTVGATEKFTVQLLDQAKGTFALLTSGGYYVTAVNGGGIGGPNDKTSPIHTDATRRGGWETLIFEQQTDGTYAIRTTTGYYLTAVNGGGYGEAQNAKPIHTDARKRGGWETFTVEPVS